MKKKTALAAALAALVLFCLAPAAFACSPSMEYMNMPLKAKIAGQPVAFIGKVEEATAGKVVFRIGAPGQGAAAKGETMEFTHKGYGTCGELQFKAGEVWLYAGDSPLGPSQRVEEADMDAAFDDVVARLESPQAKQ